MRLKLPHCKSKWTHWSMAYVKAREKQVSLVDDAGWQPKSGCRRWCSWCSPDLISLSSWKRGGEVCLSFEQWSCWSWLRSNQDDLLASIVNENAQSCLPWCTCCICVAAWTCKRSLCSGMSSIRSNEIPLLVWVYLLPSIGSKAAISPCVA